MAMQETDIAKMRILSPVNGIVLKRAAEPGQTVASSLQAPVLFTLAEDLARMQLEADVDEADIGAVKTGQKASFTVDAYPGKSFPAVIDTIEYSPKVTDNVVTYKAVLTVDNNDLLLQARHDGDGADRDAGNHRCAGRAQCRPALRSRRGNRHRRASASPRSSCRACRDSRNPPAPSADGERTICVLETGAPKEVKVKTGVSDGAFTEIHIWRSQRRRCRSSSPRNRRRSDERRTAPWSNSRPSSATMAKVADWCGRWPASI